MADVTVEMRHSSVVLGQVARTLEGHRILNRIGDVVEQEAKGNALMKPGRSFWRGMAKSVEKTNDRANRTVTVGTDHEAAAQKQFGGVIEAPGKGPGALGAKALTIPLGVARNRRWNTRDAAEKFNLFLARSGGRCILFGRLRDRLWKGGRGGGQDEPRPLFVLKKRVSQQPDKWFPEGAQLERAVAKGIEDYRKLTGDF